MHQFLSFAVFALATHLVLGCDPLPEEPVVNPPVPGPVDNHIPVAVAHALRKRERTGREIIVIPSLHSCEDGWTSFNGACYKILTSASTNTAETACEQLGSKLVSIHSEEENRFIVDLGNKIVGTNFQYTIGFKGLSSAAPYSTIWSDGTTGAFINNMVGGQQWNPDLCYVASGQGLTRYEWKKLGCTFLSMAVCKIVPSVTTARPTVPTVKPTEAPIVTVKPTEPTPVTPCEEGWKYFEATDSCYKVLPKSKVNTAIEQCEQAGSHLVSIHTEAENKFVVDMGNLIPETNFQYVIGFKKLSSSKPYTAFWSDGSNAPFTNGIEALNTEWSDAFCYKVSGEGLTRYTWNKIGCSYLAMPVCKKPAVKPSPCEVGWTHFNETNACYKVLPAVTCQYMDEPCDELDSYAASVHSDAENKFLADLGNSYPGSAHPYGIGLIRNRHNEQEVEWTDGTKCEYLAKFEREDKGGLCWTINGAGDENSGKYQWSDQRKPFMLHPICKKFIQA